MNTSHTAKFSLGQIVRHRAEPLHGVVVDVDAAYAGPADGPGPDRRDQPFYRILAVEEESRFLIYAAEEVLESDPEMILSPEDRARWFSADRHGHLAPHAQPIH